MTLWPRPPEERASCTAVRPRPPESQDAGPPGGEFSRRVLPSLLRSLSHPRGDFRPEAKLAFCDTGGDSSSGKQEVAGHRPSAGQGEGGTAGRGPVLGVTLAWVTESRDFSSPLQAVASAISRLLSWVTQRS